MKSTALRTIYFFLFWLIPFAAVRAANPGGITGTVIDSLNKKPVEYASVSVFNQSSGKLVGGSTTVTGGKFTVEKLPAGNYRLKISFLGYTDKFISNLKITIC